MPHKRLGNHRNRRMDKSRRRIPRIVLYPPLTNIYALTKIAERSKCLVIKAGAYRVVDTAYTAWLLPKATEYIQRELFEAITLNPNLAKRTPYTARVADNGVLECQAKNATDSKVFNQFETFLKDKIGINLNPPTLQRTQKAKPHVQKNSETPVV